MKWGVRRARRGKAATSDSGKTKRRTARTVYSKSPKNLTNAEMMRRIQRMEMEKRYNDLNKRNVSQGEKIATEILTNVGKQAAINVGTKLATGALGIGVNAALGKAGGTFAKELQKQFNVKKK